MAENIVERKKGENGNSQCHCDDPESAQAPEKSVDKKKLFICHPDNPDPLEEFYYSDYKRKVFLDSIKIFEKCLRNEGSVEVIHRTNLSSDQDDLVDVSEKIKECDVVIMICCPALVYLLSNEAADEHKIEETQTIVELKTIQGEFLVSNAIKIIPVVINNTTDNIHNNISTAFIKTKPVKICIATPADGECEFWPAQKRSITRLINVIHGTVVISPDSNMLSPINELEVVDMDWCIYFMDQYGIDFVACVFEERGIQKDIETLQSYLATEDCPFESGLCFRELLRTWLRRVRKSTGREFLLKQFLLLVSKFGRDDLYYQLQAQIEVYKIQVYNYQTVAHPQHPQAKPPKPGNH